MRIHTLRGLDPACRRHQGAILESIETTTDVGPGRLYGTIAARSGLGAADHLEHCETCRNEAMQALLTLGSIRDWTQDVAVSVVPVDGWPRLRARLEASRQRAREAAWRARANLAGLIASTLIVAVVVGPLTVAGSSQGWTPAREPAGLSSRDRFVGPTELEYLARTQVPAVIESTVTHERTFPSTQRLLPDGFEPTTKEVNPTETTGRTRDVS